MAENYNLGAKFGLNVSAKGLGLGSSSLESSTQKDSSDLFRQSDNFLAKYEDVFNGKVEHDINMYSRQSMIISMNMKSSDQNVRRFDMNI